MGLHRLLQSPLKVFLFCLVFGIGSLIINGGWVRLYSLRRDQTELRSQIAQLRQDTAALEGQLKRAKDPAFIERQALDQLDMATDEDLIFVFSE
jgi:cell division protein FtsB